MNLSEHFTLNEIEESETADRIGANNIIPPEMIQYWKAGCDYLEAVRKFNGEHALKITSGYRNFAVNSATRGASKTSHHMGKSKGFYCCAFDIKCANGNATLFRNIKEQVEKKRFDCDQLIWEYGDDKAPAWVHVGFVFGKKMRGQILRKRVGSTKYEELA